MADFINDLPVWQRAVLVLLVAVAAHVSVRLLRAASRQAMSSGFATHITKTRTLVSLGTSALVFAIYFASFGFALGEIGVSLTTYFASASIIGLAVAFGSQGFVQDVVNGLTIVFSGSFDIGDVVEVSGEVGEVERFGLRYTVLRSPLGAKIMVPNRSILNVVSYPRGYVRCLVDLVLPTNAEAAARLEESARAMTDAARDQFPGILRAPPEITGPHATRDGKAYLRIKFRIWPERGAPIEGYFRQALLQAAKSADPDYADWMVAVNYEIETYAPPRRRAARG